MALRHHPTKRSLKKEVAKLNEQGYAVAVCYGCNEAIKKILKYLKLGKA